MGFILETKNVTKVYGKQKVVDMVNMHVKKGEIYGFLGPNGAGKSTILKMILNLVKPTSGEIKVFGEKVKDEDFEMLKRIGSIIENPYFYRKLTGRENLELHCEYMGYYNKERIDEVLNLLGLENAGDKAVSQYSLGMKQRIALARAMLTHPELLILDEPINGLDPEGIQEIRALVRKINKNYGTTIIMSSHILSEIEMVADTIGIIKEGKLLKELSMEAVHEYNSKYIELEVNDTSKAGYILDEKANIKNYKIVSDNKIRIYENNISKNKITKILVANEVELECIFQKESTLEEYFLNLIQEEHYVKSN